MVPNQISKLDLIQARIDVIPPDWQLCKVAEALNIRNNLRKPISQEVRETIKGDYPYYGPTKVQGYISEYEQDGTYALIGEDGDHFLKYATMPQTQYISGKCTVNNHAHILESSEICDAQWFFNYFKHRDITNFLSRQGAGRFKLNKATLEKLPMLVPPLPEQRKIAETLSTWDKAITTTEKLIEASKQQKKALMQQLLTGKKRLMNPETGKAFDDEWEYVRAGNVFLTRSNKKHNSDLPILAITQDQGAVPRELIDYKVSVTDDSISGYKVVEQGDFIISLRSFQGGIEYSRYKGICSPAYVILYPKLELVDGFYKYHLKSHPFIQAMKSRLEGIRDGKIISYKYFSEIKLPRPSLEEQQKIASVLTTADKEIEVLETKLAHLKQEKKALMQQLLTGKRRVKVNLDMEIAI
ncbi:restriction endonuclease subunit S [Vibrio atlanticus]|uniref:restriction endonuclease subunit S n=1 Tax=Vibrio atlanticus TaxID=693153 RepID=UPI003CF648D5